MTFTTLSLPADENFDDPDLDDLLDDIAADIDDARAARQLPSRAQVEQLVEVLNTALEEVRQPLVLHLHDETCHLHLTIDALKEALAMLPPLIERAAILNELFLELMERRAERDTP